MFNGKLKQDGDAAMLDEFADGDAGGVDVYAGGGLEALGHLSVGAHLA
jgi:hypothetical protein